MAFSNQPLQKHLLLVTPAAATGPPWRSKRIRVLPAPILHKEVGKGQGRPQSFPFPTPPLGHVRVIICGLGVHCALAGRRAMTLKGALFIFILYSYPSSQHPSRPDAIVCVDACFTQKHNQQIRDPARRHPRTVFIAEADAQHMENYVDNIRPAKPRNKKKKANSSTDESTLEEDGYEGPLRVPTSVLDGCERSFLAADEQREKASTQFFASTALMAMLCCHDRVLWVVDMRSAGEKQHYVLVLLEILFQHLPPRFAIGLLYDIACQTHRSCVKWDFLKPYHHRLIFGISVFHAFGHQWPCQVIYHPRKRKGFGFSDGEGCERFWHSISKLIAYLRVCGVRSIIFEI